MWGPCPSASGRKRAHAIAWHAMLHANDIGATNDPHQQGTRYTILPPFAGMVGHFGASGIRASPSISFR